MGGGRPRRHRHPRMDDELYNGVKLGENWKTDIQVAINDGNRREDVFFMIRMGKAGTSLPYQQPIPLDFARYHLGLQEVNVTLESPNGLGFKVAVLGHSNGMRFGKGWRQFSMENHLQEGYQLLVTKVGKLHFKVTFYDQRGKCCTSFPPLQAQRAVVESRWATIYDEEHHASDPPTPSAIPLQGESKVQNEPTRTKPSLLCLKEGILDLKKVPCAFTLQLTELATRPAALDSNQAKFILRHFLPQLTAAPKEDVREHAFNARIGFPSLDELTEKEQAIGEAGKDYINLDSDDGNDLAPVEAPEFQKLDGSKLAVFTTTIRDEFEQTGFHSPSGKQQLLTTPKIESDDDGGDDDDEEDNIPLKRLGPRASESFQIRQTQPVRAVRKKVSVRRTSCWKRQRSPSPSPALVVAATTRSGYHGIVGDTSGRGNNAAAAEDGSMETLNSDHGTSRAMRLLQQQGCQKFSEITVPKPQRCHFNDGRRAVKAAMSFASLLQNAKFLAVMCDAQVYHGFHLPIPREILEVTGTLKSNKVKVCLTDREQAFYMANWAWHDFCETPLLNTDGWAKFALDHTLEQGDVCVFELIDNDAASALLFCVHIFRVVALQSADKF